MAHINSLLGISCHTGFVKSVVYEIWLTVLCRWYIAYLKQRLTHVGEHVLRI